MEKIGIKAKQNLSLGASLRSTALLRAIYNEKRHNRRKLAGNLHIRKHAIICNKDTLVLNGRAFVYFL